MALVKFGAGVVQMSGSIAGTTFARNASGNYARSRTTPVNTSTPLQEKIRAVVAYLTDRWLETVTTAERAAWGDYGSAVTMKNRLSDSIKLSGFNHYLRSNSARLYAGKSVIDAAPAIFSLPEQDPTLAFTASAATQNMSIVFANTHTWATAAGGFLFIRMSRPQSPTRNFFRSPLLYAGAIVGDATPPTSPQTMAVTTPIAVGQKLWIKARASLVDGRLSEIMSAGPTLVTS